MSERKRPCMKRSEEWANEIAMAMPSPDLDMVALDSLVLAIQVEAFNYGVERGPYSPRFTEEVE